MMELRKFFLKFYRRFQSKWVQTLLLPFFFSKERRSRSFFLALESVRIPPRKQNKQRYWFHASSAGELEGLWTVILTAAERQIELILTVFSESAFHSLEKLKNVLLIEKQVSPLYCGYSPWEGEWLCALDVFCPTCFITFKYEAWPDLWVSLKERKISLAVVAASDRRSVRVAKWFSQFLVGNVPDLLFLPVMEREIIKLEKLFPNAKIKQAGEPRWDRVYLRSQSGHPRARQVIEQFKDFNRPWGMLGSIWLEDLEFFSSLLKKIRGTLWIVPHQVDEANVQLILDFLTSLNVSPLQTHSRVGSFKTTSSKPSSLKTSNYLLVNETGFLSELYTVADWVYVGGGFGKGVHSTIEPAIQGTPISAGPKGIRQFSEIEFLRKSGQLKILEDDKQLSCWIEFAQSIRSDQKTEWMKQCQSRLGASQKIIQALENFTCSC